LGHGVDASISITKLLGLYAIAAACCSYFDDLAIYRWASFSGKIPGYIGIDDEYVMSEESFGAAMGAAASTHLCPSPPRLVTQLQTADLRRALTDYNVG